MWKSIYPRGLSLGNENLIKPDINNTNRILEAINSGHLKPGDHVITYNKRTMRVVDGTHLHDALAQKYGFEKDLDDKWFKEIDIPVESEGLYAVHYNCRHGLQVSRDDMKAMLAKYLDDEGKLKYGDIPKISKLWNMQEATLKRWLQDIRYGTRQIGDSVSDSSGNGGSEEAEDIKAQKAENERLQEENKQLKKERDEFEIRWNQICPTHKQAITKCGICGH